MNYQRCTDPIYVTITYQIWGNHNTKNRLSLRSSEMCPHLQDRNEAAPSSETSVTNLSILLGHLDSWRWGYYRCLEKSASHYPKTLPHIPEERCLSLSKFSLRLQKVSEVSVVIISVESYQAGKITFSPCCKTCSSKRRLYNLRSPVQDHSSFNIISRVLQISCKKTWRLTRHQTLIF